MNRATKASIVFIGSSLIMAGFVVRATEENGFKTEEWEEYRRCYKRLGKDVKSCIINEQGVTWTFYEKVDS